MEDGRDLFMSLAGAVVPKIVATDGAVNAQILLDRDSDHSSERKWLQGK
jgi:hypothetical protein